MPSMTSSTPTALITDVASPRMRMPVATAAGSLRPPEGRCRPSSRFGHARSQPLCRHRQWRHPALALPRISGAHCPDVTQRWHCQGFLASATQDWHCQRFLANAAQMPLSVGTAKDYWRARPQCHSGLALPTISGGRATDATELWHFQGCLSASLEVRSR